MTSGGNKNNNTTVCVGMSGGVDSSVAAFLLKQQGYRVIGLFMHNWEEEQDGECCAAKDYEDAKAVCGKLNIPIYSINFSEQYMENVFSYFLEEYKRGRTPNPDVLCNREIKFGPFLNYALNLGADYIATGHYCNIEHNGDNSILKKAEDKDKDQTYFLNQVKTAQLKNVMFPIGHLKKSEVRRIAEENGLVTAGKKDSTGICFIGERKFKQFLAKYLPAKRGKIVDISGREIGMHDGLMYYTLGQRRGLNIGGIKGEEGRWYVVDKNLNTNTLVVSCKEGEELFSSGLHASGLNIIGGEVTNNCVSFNNTTECGYNIPKKLLCKAKMRYRQDEQDVELIIKGADEVLVNFKNKQRAVTPGQYVVFYLNDRCLGGAVIDTVIL